MADRHHQTPVALADKGFSDAQLAEIKRMIDAEKSDLFAGEGYLSQASARTPS